MYPDALDAAVRIEGLPMSCPETLADPEEEEGHEPKRRLRYRHSLQLLKPFRITNKWDSPVIVIRIVLRLLRHAEKCAGLVRVDGCESYEGSLDKPALIPLSQTALCLNTCRLINRLWTFSLHCNSSVRDLQSAVQTQVHDSSSIWQHKPMTLSVSGLHSRPCRSQSHPTVPNTAAVFLYYYSFNQLISKGCLLCERWCFFLLWHRSHIRNRKNSDPGNC